MHSAATRASHPAPYDATNKMAVTMTPMTMEQFKCFACEYLSPTYENMLEHLQAQHANDAEENATQIAENGEQNQDLDMKVKGNKHWTIQMVRLLLQCYAQHRHKFKDMSSKEVWRLIASDMKDEGCNVDGIQCDEKWRNMKKTYRKHKLTGRGTPKWEYYDAMDDVLGDTLDVVPGPTGYELSKGSFSSSPTTTEDSPPPPPSSSSNFLQRKSRKRSADAPDWLKIYVHERRLERTERKKRFREMLEMKRKELEAKTEFRKNLLALFNKFITSMQKEQT